MPGVRDVLQKEWSQWSRSGSSWERIVKNISR